MEGYASEKEQIEEIRKWWDANGKAVLGGLALGLVVLFGYRYWDASRNALAEQASINYEHFLTVAAQGPGKEASEAGESLIATYPETAYAKLAALLLASLEVRDKKPEDAEKHLRWVVEHSGSPELRAVAQTRLAALLLARGDTAAADAIVKQLPAAGDNDRYAELRGDLLAAQGKADEAHAMYLEAIAALKTIGGDPSSLQIKLDNLGLTAATE
ncbi:MAG: tetratricopeptide repeat protein [Gammaproteobacteria bacterium]|nr:tetratricopeptide repeat protein [Gammaproteobacteria bacterium]MBI5615731.1 tetratricopeptide repeat protein [Gammaproteobacteria bacterium]